LGESYKTRRDGVLLWFQSDIYFWEECPSSLSDLLIVFLHILPFNSTVLYLTNKDEAENVVSCSSFHLRLVRFSWEMRDMLQEASIMSIKGIYHLIIFIWLIMFEPNAFYYCWLSGNHDQDFETRESQWFMPAAEGRCLCAISTITRQTPWADMFHGEFMCLEKWQLILARFKSLYYVRESSTPWNAQAVFELASSLGWWRGAFSSPFTCSCREFLERSMCLLQNSSFERRDIPLIQRLQRTVSRYHVDWDATKDEIDDLCRPIGP